jgi:hypothetical protein
MTSQATANLIEETLELARALAKERTLELSAMIVRLRCLIATRRLGTADRRTVDEALRTARYQLALLRAAGVCLDRGAPGVQSPTDGPPTV